MTEYNIDHSIVSPTMVRSDLGCGAVIFVKAVKNPYGHKISWDDGVDDYVLEIFDGEMFVNGELLDDLGINFREWLLKAHIGDPTEFTKAACEAFKILTAEHSKLLMEADNLE